MRLRWCWWVAIGLTLAALAASLILYPRMPERVPIHWNIQGQADGFAPKSWGLFLCPGLMAGMIGLFALFPWLSPRNFEVDSFRKTYEFLLVLLTGLFGYIHALTLIASLAPEFEMGRALIAGIFLVFTLLGNVMGKVQRNFWIGIRVPWTLASERVWNDTHRLAAWLWTAGGLVGFVAALAGYVVVAFGVLVVVTLVPIVHSLVLYKRLERRGEV
jgi:uncharacterized membrane protein